MKTLIFNFLILVIICSAGKVSAQERDAISDIWLNSQTDDFATIREQAEAYFADPGHTKGYKQWKRWEYINQNRLTPDGKITNYAKMNLVAYQQYLGVNGIQFPQPQPSDASVTNGSWYFLGPTDYTGGSYNNIGLGRVNCIAFHPTSATTIFAGTPAGGLWKTTDDGGSWTNLTDGIPSIGVSGIAINPGNPNIIYILTGDGDAGDTPCVGVLKSTNGGTTWAETGLTAVVLGNARGYKLAMHPSNSSILFAVTGSGIFKTVNSGTTWTEVQSGSFRDFEFKPGTPATAYASTSTSFYRSTDTGDNWTLITSGLPSGESRIAIGVSPDNPVYVYLLCGPGGSSGAGTYKGLYRSFDSGLNFGTQSTTPNILDGGSTGAGDGDQAWYDLAIAVDPDAVGTVLTGGINIWKSTNFGVTFSNNTHWAPPGAWEYTHADIHALEYNPINGHLYVGSDGGLYKSTNDGTVWTDISEGADGLGIMQFYRIAGNESNSTVIIGGAQDNGSNRYTTALGTTIFHMRQADGMDCAIDPTNVNNMYSMSQNGGLASSTDFGVTWTGIVPAGATGAWVTPLVHHHTATDILYAGYDDVYKTTNGGSSWTNVGVDGRGAIAMGTNNSSRVYASNGSSIWMSNDAGGTWTSISAGLPGIGISYITVNPDNSPEVYVTLSGFTAGQKVYRSFDAGSTWTNISGSLPNIIVNCIAFEDNNGSPDDAVYIGTDVGVFYRDTNLDEWVPFKNWLPTVPVFDLEINNTSELITAGTFGRGLWRSQTYGDCVPSWLLSGTGGPGYSYYQASNSITSSRLFNQGVGQEGNFKAGNKVVLTTGFNVAGGSTFRAWNDACGLGIPGNGDQGLFVETPDVFPK